jgi:hypothetical protein
MAIQDFTAGQVLTAAQMDSLQANDYNQTVNTSTASYVLVALDKGTRRVMNAAGATTITVDDSLFTAGDTLQLQNIGAGVCTVTAGTATVSSAGPLAIPQYGSGTLYFTSAGVAIYFPSAVTVAAPPASALTLVGSGTLSGTDTTFSSVFSATYNNYLVLIDDVYANTGSNAIGLQLGTLVSGYNAGGGRTTATTDGFWQGSATSTTVRMGTAFSSAADATSFHINIMNPYLTVPKRVFGTSVTSDDQIYFYAANSDTTSFTDFKILLAANNFAGTRSVRIYGYALS